MELPSLFDADRHLQFAIAEAKEDEEDASLHLTILAAGTTRGCTSRCRRARARPSSGSCLVSWRLKSSYSSPQRKASSSSSASKGGA